MTVSGAPNRTRFRSILLMLLGLMIVIKILFLSPSILEEKNSSATPISPQNLLQEQASSLVPGLPKNRIAEYTIENFNYVSVQGGEKLWRLQANQAFLYNPERLVHSRQVTVYLFDPDGKSTVVVGDEARYFMNKKDLELYGHVRTKFPDGFELNSDYLQYLPDQKTIYIPPQYLSYGKGQQTQSQSFQFKSNGLNYKMKESLVVLTQNVEVTLDSKESPSENSAQNSPTPTPKKMTQTHDFTQIHSDHCVIYRDKNLAKFTMNPKRAAKERHIHITQPGLFVRARRADLNYGDYSAVLRYLVASEDVLIKETAKPKPLTDDQKLEALPPPQALLRYSTSGQAEFDTKQNIIVLTKFPQVYQNGDTVVGDIITLHRDTDIIEVDHSNAFSEGSGESK